MKPLPTTFFDQDAVIVAEQLLGKLMTLNGCSGMIVETEAYKDDPASHAFRRTSRSDIMFSTSGHWYVYLIYGMYHCLNITTNGQGKPGAVLIRAVEPIDGIEQMKKRRKTDNIPNLCSGPGKLCSALNIDKRYNGQPVNSRIMLTDFRDISPKDIKTSQRIGIKDAQELKWRFCVKANLYVSGRR